MNQSHRRCSSPSSRTHQDQQRWSGEVQGSKFLELTAHKALRERVMLFWFWKQRHTPAQISFPPPVPFTITFLSPGNFYKHHLDSLQLRFH